MHELPSFGQILKEYRKARDLTQEELAEQVLCSVTMIKKVEADKIRPSRVLSESLADVLRVPEGERETFIRRARRLPDESELQRYARQEPRGAGDQPARLRALVAAVAPSELVLAKQAYVVGRHSSCDIVVAATIVSRVHAKIEPHGPRYLLQDAGSRNGTFVNGRRIDEPHLLTHDDQIGFGSAESVLCFFDPDPTALSKSS